MNVIRDCPAARWLPSRHRFALAKLIAFTRFHRRVASPMNVDHLLLAIDRDQTAWEHFAISALVFLTAFCYIAAALPLSLGFAILAAIPLATLAVQLPLATGLGAKANATLEFLLLLLASAYFAVAETSIRYVAWCFLALVILNAVAWLVMLMLRDHVRNLELKCAK